MYHDIKSKVAKAKVGAEVQKMVNAGAGTVNTKDNKDSPNTWKVDGTFPGTKPA
jgi:hypothetical protein